MNNRFYAFKNGWRWAIKCATPIAALRCFWDAYVRGHNGETCYFCGRPYIFWHVSDDLWERFSGNSGLCCPTCFDKRADHGGVILKWEGQVWTRPG